VTGTKPMVKSSSADFDQWTFVIDQLRRAPVCTENIIPR
jgi:hypothetical protein